MTLANEGLEARSVIALRWAAPPTRMELTSELNRFAQKG
jgi:hypothetical protein